MRTYATYADVCDVCVRMRTYAASVEVSVEIFLAPEPDLMFNTCFLGLAWVFFLGAGPLPDAELLLRDDRCRRRRRR